MLFDAKTLRHHGLVIDAKANKQGGWQLTANIDSIREAYRKEVGRQLHSWPHVVGCIGMGVAQHPTYAHSANC
eukprot:scaffold270296_cov41-Tisochrysis_lutea.AAC.2